MDDFRKYATKHLGMNSLVLDDVIKSQAGYLNPYILEERQLNVTQLDVFSRLMMDRIIFLGTQVDDYTANTLQAQLLYLDSVDPGKDISIYINSPGANQSYILTAVVDEAFLLDEDTVYPVTIDPSVEVQSYRGEMIKNIEDVPLYNGRANHTHGSNAYNVIGRMDYWSGVYHGTGRTLVRFPGLISNFAYQCLDPDDITAVRYVMRENSGKSGTSQIDAYFFKEYWSHVPPN